jgi:hypothetical protein
MIKTAIIPQNAQVLHFHKVYIPKVGGLGNDSYVLGHPFYGSSVKCVDAYREEHIALA